MYFNPRSSCEERRGSFSRSFARRIISIHAPHARSDRHRQKGAGSHEHFNPRSSCEERQHYCGTRSRRQGHFNPRSSCEERRSSIIGSILYTDFNPRSSCEERRQQEACQPVHLRISIHAPHARSDHSSGYSQRHYRISIHAPHARSDKQGKQVLFTIVSFQSTLLMRGATRPSA